MKRFFSMLLVCTLVILSFAACTSDPQGTETAANTDTKASVTEQPLETLPDTPIPADAISVATWGVQSGEGHGRTNSFILLEKLIDLPDGSTVYFPEGTYELIFPMFLVSKKNIRLVGENATLLRTDVTNVSAQLPALTDPSIPEFYRPLTAHPSFIMTLGMEGITVEGFTFAYAVPTSLSGRVVAVQGSAVDVEVTDGSVISGDEYITVVNTFTDDGLPDKTFEQYATDRFPAEKIGENTLRVTALDPGGVTNLREGMRVCLRMCTARSYVLHIQESADVVLRDLTMQSSFNGGVMLTDRCENATLQNVRMESPNPDALMSLNADALHISDLGGYLNVNGCHFDRAGDDGVNVHSMAYIVKAVNEKTVTLENSRFTFGAHWAKAGDTLRFYDAKTFAILGEAAVSAVDASAGTVTLDSIPTGVTDGSLVTNRALAPSVVIHNTVVQNTRARGLLLQTERVTVADCTFRNTALAGILVAPDVSRWYEMAPTANLMIRNNRFENCGDHAAGAIQLAADHSDAAQVYSSYIHSAVSIRDNMFSDLQKPAVYATCTEGLTIVGNTMPSDSTAAPFVMLIHCNGVKLDGVPSDRLDATDVTDLTVSG